MSQSSARALARSAGCIAPARMSTSALSAEYRARAPSEPSSSTRSTSRCGLQHLVIAVGAAIVVRGREQLLSLELLEDRAVAAGVQQRIAQLAAECAQGGGPPQEPAPTFPQFRENVASQIGADASRAATEVGDSAFPLGNRFARRSQVKQL